MFFVAALKDGRWLHRQRLMAYSKIFLFVATVLGLAWISGFHQVLLPGEGALVTDFVNVYAAGQAVHEGQPADAYVWTAQREREDALRQALSDDASITKDTGVIPWLYPPMFLAVGWLAAFFPYFLALGLYSLIGLVVYAASMRRLLPPYKEAWVLLAAFPGVFINLFSGQNGFITTALFAAGLSLLETSPVAAGVAFGALCYKPHFFVLIPLALLVGRYGKAFVATVLSAAVCCGLSWFFFGAESWLAFFHGLQTTQSAVLELGTDHWLGIQHSVFSMVRVFGGSLSWAYAAQMLVGVIAAMAVVHLWWKRRASFEVRGAVLVGAALLISPYFFATDQVLLAIPIALLAREGLRDGFLPFEKTFLFALALLPLLVKSTFAYGALPLAPLMLGGLLFLCWRRGRKEWCARRNSNPQPSDS